MRHAIFSIFFLVSLIASVPAADEPAILKKGCCMGGADAERTEKRIKSLNVGWHYNWTASWKGRDIKGVPFVPMIFKNDQWTAGSLDKVKVAKSKMGSSPLLGFNEPDGKAQANMTVEQALKFWPELEKTNRRLGSPATVHPDNEWMKAFMKGADEKGLRVDFVCVHWYGQLDAEKFIERMREIHELYDKPIWITEFAIADWSAKSLRENKYTDRDVLKFMEDVLPELEKLEFVERYAWFDAKADDPKLGRSALFDKAGELTELGRFYADFKSGVVRAKR
ncbi:MAG: glycoside hydrolase family protein [Verrucomicrobiales bacterium]